MVPRQIAEAWVAEERGALTGGAEKPPLQAVSRSPLLGGDRKGGIAPSIQSCTHYRCEEENSLVAHQTQLKSLGDQKIG